MKTRSLIGLLAPALLSVAAASQTIVVVRPLPFTGVPRSLPSPLTGMPLPMTRLPSPAPLPMPIPLARLEGPQFMPLMPMPLAAPPVLPAVRMEAEAERPLALRLLPSLRMHLEEATRTEQKPAKDAELLGAVFDGRELTLPEDDLERELGMK